MFGELMHLLLSKVLHVYPKRISKIKKFNVIQIWFLLLYFQPSFLYKKFNVNNWDYLFVQLFLGLTWIVGCVALAMFLLLGKRTSPSVRQILYQASGLLCGLSILAVSIMPSYQGCLASLCGYGIFLGAYHYSLKTYTYSKVRSRNYPEAWGLVQGSQAISVLIGMPATGKCFYWT